MTADPSDHEHYPKHACGVIGVFNHKDAGILTYYGLYALQHRGQESAGIVTVSKKSEFVSHKGMGLVSRVFKQKDLKKLKGKMSVGHVRYSTTGASHESNIQPMTVDCHRGQIAIAHNGNLTNAAQLRQELERQGSIFQTTVDSEIILHLLAQPNIDGEENNLIRSIRRIEGAFSIVIMTEREIIAVRDPCGLRPLSLGRKDEGWIVASETCAFDLVGAEFYQDIEPGEVMIIDEDGVRSMQAFPQQRRRAFCIFEYVYFSRPDSVVEGKNVYRVRENMGRELARENPIKADLVIPIPDSGVCAALGYSAESGIPFEMGFVRNHYIGRSFLQPSQLIRDFNVRVKLNLIKELVSGKRVIIIDDSIVRGTTSRAHVKNLREAGAKEVHVLVSCPAHKNPCFYGIDFPSTDELLAANKSLDQIRDYLDADSVAYLSIDGMVKATGRPKDEFCLACYTGDYPVAYKSNQNKSVMDQLDRRKDSLGQALSKQESHPKLL